LQFYALFIQVAHSVDVIFPASLGKLEKRRVKVLSKTNSPLIYLIMGNFIASEKPREEQLKSVIRNLGLSSVTSRTSTAAVVEASVGRVAVVDIAVFVVTDRVVVAAS
jgi:hypothetical protein